MIARLLLILGLLLAGCSTMRVQSDYDPAFDFKALQTFAVVYAQSETVTLTQERIANAVTDTIRAKGYKSVKQEAADFLIVFHTDVTSKKQVVTDYQSVGFYPYYGYGYRAPMAVPVQREYDYDEGKIIVDAMAPKSKRIFWRGIATDELKNFDTPQERTAYINRVTASVLETFPGR